MATVRRRLAALSVAVAIAGCGGGGESSDEGPDRATAATPPSGVTDEPTDEPSVSNAGPPDTDGLPPTTDPMPSGDLCDALDQDEPPPDLAALVPPEYSQAAQTLLDITGPFELDEISTPPDVTERFADADTAADLAALADEAERRCGPSESVDGIRFYAQISEFAQPMAPPGYCDQLSILVSPESDDNETDAALAAAIDLAPTQHVAALEEVQVALRAYRDAAPVDEDVTSTFAALGGIGLYAEARCGVADSFATMLFAGAFLLAGNGLSPSPAEGLVTVPMPADASAANAAVPAGRDLTFEVTEIDIDDDGDYLVSAVVPTAWERDDSPFGTTFEPDNGFGIFTEMSIDTGCDGVCEPTDWETLLTSPDGYIGQRRNSEDPFVDRPIDDTPGVVMAWAGFADGIEGAVLRWADDTDRYFVCEFQLSQEDVDLADAFLAACEAARPGWIPGA